MKYKHIIFDIDGTMLDSAYADLTALQRVILELQNNHYPIRDLHFALGIPSEVALKQLGFNEGSKANLLWNSYMQELSYTMKLFDGIKDLLVELNHKGVKLGIITSKNKEEFHNDFTPLGINTYFDTIITVEDSIAPKPSAEPMIVYLNQTEINPQEALYIGDSLYDWECATNAGVDFGVAIWGAHSVEQIHATHYFKTPKEVLNVFSK